MHRKEKVIILQWSILTNIQLYEKRILLLLLPTVVEVSRLVAAVAGDGVMIMVEVKVEDQEEDGIIRRWIRQQKSYPNIRRRYLR